MNCFRQLYEKFVMVCCSYPDIALISVSEDNNSTFNTKLTLGLDKLY